MQHFIKLSSQDTTSILIPFKYLIKLCIYKWVIYERCIYLKIDSRNWLTNTKPTLYIEIKDCSNVLKTYFLGFSHNTFRAYQLLKCLFLWEALSCTLQYELYTYVSRVQRSLIFTNITFLNGNSGCCLSIDQSNNW